MDDCGFDCLGAEDPSVAPSLDDVRKGLRVIGRGMKGDSVVYVQGLTGAIADGDFGSKTEKAVKAFQRSNGLSDTGIVAASTMAALDKLAGGTAGIGPAKRTEQKQAALEAAAAAEQAKTPAEAQAAAQVFVDNTVFEPVEIRLAANKALAKAKAATTPEQVKDAAKDVKAAAQAISWPTWKIAAVAGGGVVALGALLLALFGGAKVAQA